METGKTAKTGGEERKRLDAARSGRAPWRRWGPDLSERQWGTVREDYSTDENAWEYFTHDQARSRAYHWGEDGLAGLSADQQQLCFALALWNGRDPIWMPMNVVLIRANRRAPTPHAKDNTRMSASVLEIAR